MDYTFLILLALILILLYIVFRQRDAISYLRSRIDEINSSIPNWIDGAVAKSFQNSAAVFESVFSSAISKNTEVIKGAFATSLKELGIQEDLGKLSQASSELKNITSDLKTMFQIKHARAKFGELQLENLLRDIFPASRLVFQKNIGYGIPDACVMVEDSKYLCIDSKFPLENFRRYSEAESEEERSRYWKYSESWREWEATLTNSNPISTHSSGTYRMPTTRLRTLKPP
jgi:DNA recombination protein RmuC